VTTSLRFLKVVLDQVELTVDLVPKAVLADKEDQVIRDPGDSPDYEEIRVVLAVLVLMACQERLVDKEPLEKKVLMTV